jgi:hypothetical protein
MGGRGASSGEFYIRNKKRNRKSNFSKLGYGIW